MDMLSAKPEPTTQGDWVRANNGSEEPFLYKGRRLLYVWQPSSGHHGYLDLDRDMVYRDLDTREMF